VKEGGIEGRGWKSRRSSGSKGGIEARTDVNVTEFE